MVARSFDHLVGTCKDRGRNCEPSALAVLRLIINSNVVGCSTGRSGQCGRADQIAEHDSELPTFGIGRSRWATEDTLVAQDSADLLPSRG